MESFNYSKCTYKELNTILKRYKRNLECKNLRYEQLARIEYCKIKDYLNSCEFEGSNKFLDIMNGIYNDIYSNLSLLELQQLKESVLREPNNRINQLKLKILSTYIDKSKKRDRIKTGNKRRFLLKGRV